MLKSGKLRISNESQTKLLNRQKKSFIKDYYLRIQLAQ